MSSVDLPPVPRLPSRAGSRPRRAPRVRALSRDVIARAALSVVDREGLDAMTMRRVAEELKTGAASLYAHVSGKDELLELVVEQVIAEVPLGGEPDPENWEEQIKGALRSIRAVFARHRDVARASFARIPLGERALVGMDWMLGVMRAGGLPDDVAALAGDLLSLYTMAIAYEESLYAGEGNTPEQIAEYIASIRTYFASLPAERFPNMVALAAPLTAGDAEGNERFEFGLDVLLRGLASLAS